MREGGGRQGGREAGRGREDFGKTLRARFEQKFVVPDFGNNSLCWILAKIPRAGFWQELRVPDFGKIAAARFWQKSLCRILAKTIIPNLEWRGEVNKKKQDN